MCEIYIFLSILVSLLSASPISKIASREDDPYRLPEGLLQVISYDLELTLPEDVFTINKFTGIVDLKFTLLQDTSAIKLHGNQLEFTEVVLTDQNNNIINLENNEVFTIDSATEFFTIITSQTLLSGETYNIHFEYNAVLSTTSYYGLYRSSYTTAQGSVRYLATTQLQGTYARRVFPCFDEPSFKARFNIRIVHPAIYNAKGNTPETVTAHPDNSALLITTFTETPIMSTYLIAFVISDFTCTEGAEIETNIPYAVCSRPDNSYIRDHAVDLGPRIIWALEELTGVKYSVSGIGKMDQYAIPDFAAGAMENWGLVTYREVGLLWDPADSTNRYRQYIATIISHEFAHMWFGDLVTTHWWSDTFLNEGFATYYEWLGSAQVEPSWELDKQFLIEELQLALVSDALPTSAALSAPASTPAEVDGRFNTNSYSKGGSIFRMVNHFLGETNYRQGITKYLTTHQFNNTKPEDLWAALQPTNGNFLPQPLDEIMYNWVYLPGYPVLKVSLDGNSVTITQQRFLSSGAADTRSQWYIPLTYTISSDATKFEDTTTRSWLVPNSDLILLEILNADDSWIVLNNYQIGFYRIDYDSNLWSRISNALHKNNFDGIPDLNRGQLVDDFYKMAQAGIYTFVDFIKFISFLEKDTSYFAWYQAFQAFNYILPKVGNSKIREALTNYFQLLLQTFYDSASFSDIDNDNQIHTLKRVLAVNWGCKLGIEDCKIKTVESFQQYMYEAGFLKPDKNLRLYVYCNGIRYSSNVQNDWSTLFQKFLGETGTEKTNMLSALGCALDEETIIGFLEKSIDSSSGLTRSDLSSVFSAVYTNNYEGIDTALDFLIQHYERVATFYGSYTIVNSIITNLGSRFTRNDQLEKLRNFAELPNLPETSKTHARNVLTTAENSVSWIEGFEKDLLTFFELDAEGGGGGGGNSSGRTRASFVVMTSAVIFLILHIVF